MKKITGILLILLTLAADAQQLPLLMISPNKRFFQTRDGKPFFWLGDTGWLLFEKCKREEATHYLDVRKQQGFNVIQVMVLHDLNAKDAYGAFALNNGDVASPKITIGNNYKSRLSDYWDHIDYIIYEAAKRGMYIGLVPIWGGNVKSGKVSVKQAEAYATFLANRYKNKSNIIWINGGDIPGNDHQEVWETIGKTLKKFDPNHLVTFHPRGRYSSSEWFDKEDWLDFNMFQSGHKDYSQDTVKTEKNHFGEDNWKYINADYQLQPVKPTLDGEPSYENIPHGLHDSLQPRWTAADVRRYLYWSVFAGGAGFTYGENAIMQFHTGTGRGSFGVNQDWKKTINAPGATQVHFIKELLLARDYFDRKPAQEIIAGNNGTGYERLAATKGKDYALIYTYTGKNFKVDFSQLGFIPTKASWFDPTNGKSTPVAQFAKNIIVEFDPPGEPKNGNDHVLVLEK